MGVSATTDNLIQMKYACILPPAAARLPFSTLNELETSAVWRGVFIQAIYELSTGNRGLSHTRLDRNYIQESEIENQ